MNITELEHHGVHGPNLTVLLGHARRGEEAYRSTVLVQVELLGERVERVPMIEEALVRVLGLVPLHVRLDGGVARQHLLHPEHVGCLSRDDRIDATRVLEVVDAQILPASTRPGV